MAEHTSAPSSGGIERLARTVIGSKREVLPFALSAGAVIAIATVGTSQVPASIAAIVLATVCLASRPLVGSAIVIVAANDVHLFRDPALGSVTAIDLAIAATVVRAVLVADRRRPTLLEFFGLAFLLTAGVATVFAHENSAVTAYGRAASYLIFGLAVGRALGRGARPQLARAFVGAQIGQAVAALIGLTPTAGTQFPIGRYLGTLGDPAQFGIPVAFAGVLVSVSPHLIRSPHARYAVAALLCVAVAGSVTRSAWAVLGLGLLLAALDRLGRERGRAVRIGLGLAGAGLVSVATAVVIVGAGAFGLTEQSASIRQRSIDAAWGYLASHPFRPTGLGNATHLAPEPVTDANPVFASTFERGNSGWIAFRNATLTRERRSPAFGRTSLKITTGGHDDNEGVQLSTIGGINSRSVYTVAFDARAPVGLPLWVYVDEYDTRDEWRTYRNATIRGAGTWRRYSWSWRTSEKTAHLRLHLVTASRVAASFFVDAVQLQAGRTTRRFGEERFPPSFIAVPAIYNTWLAVAIQLGVAAAFLLATLAIGAPYRAYRQGDRATACALGALLAPSLTESFVYGSSMVTLIWFSALGIAVTAGGITAQPPGRKAASNHADSGANLS